MFIRYKDVITMRGMSATTKVSQVIFSELNVKVCYDSGISDIIAWCVELLMRIIREHIQDGQHR